MAKIPKILHYCWFGRNPETELMQKCMASWERFLPDYELKLWNEDSFDVASNLYAKQAYEAHKWAFVTDYVRLYALYEFGGIYMDTDVEVLKKLDAFLDHSAFSGFDNDLHIPTGIMGAERNQPWIKRLLDYYTNKPFIKSDATLDLTTNCMTITKISSQEFGFEPGGCLQTLRSGVVIYPKDYFCPKSWKTKELILTPNTHTIHHFDGSWKSRKKSARIMMNLYGFLNKMGIGRGLKRFLSKVGVISKLQRLFK